MNLDDLIADDVERVFGNKSDFGADALCKPKGSDETFPCRLTFGDPAASYLATATHQEDRRIAGALGRRSILRSGFERHIGEARDPEKGDVFIINAGAYAGEWICQTAQGDNGDGMQMVVVLSDDYAIGSQKVREVR